MGYLSVFGWTAVLVGPSIVLPDSGSIDGDSALEAGDFRKVWRLNWLGALGSLANIEMQQRWLDQSIRNPAWSFAEFMCKYFDDLGWSDDGYEEKIRSGFVERDEYDCIKDFHAGLDTYKSPNGDYDQSAVLSDPAWRKIVELGRLSIIELGKLILDQEEKTVLIRIPPLTRGDFTWPN